MGYTPLLMGKLTIFNEKTPEGNVLPCIAMYQYNMQYSHIYSLVNVYITIENHQIVHRKTHYLYGHFQ